jgi:large subunit ribosomal protein L15
MVEKKGTKKPAAPKKAAAGKSKAPAGKSPKSARATAKPAPAKAAKKEAPRAVREPRPERQRAVAADTRPAGVGIHDLRPAPGSTHYRKRLGRGPGSGHGKTAGRGNKGQRSRSGYRHQRGFEGGQMPLHRRVPKRGFTNIFRVEYDIVNLSDLDRFEAGQAVTPETLAGLRLARKSRLVKILGDGEIGKALTVSAHKFSASAQAKIEAAGGRCEVLQR